MPKNKSKKDFGGHNTKTIENDDSSSDVLCLKEEERPNQE